MTLGDPNRLTGGYLYHRRMAELAPHYGARLRFIALPARPFPLPLFSGPPVLRRIGKAAPQAVVLDSIAAGYLGPWLVLQHPRVPLVPMLHQPPGGIDHGPFRTTIAAWLDRLAYHAPTRIMVASEALAHDLIREGIPSEKLVVVPPGRDVASTVGFHPGNLRRRRKAALLCVGNWVERKGIHALLEAVAMLPEDSVTLHLAGDDSAEPEYAALLRARIRRPDLAERVVVHGPCSGEEVAALYAGSDIFALPSVREPYGTVYGEAMTFGLPVIGWRAGNLPNLAEHGHEGLLAEPGDVLGLMEAIRVLAADENLRQRLGEAARRRAAQWPTWEESAALFFATLREAAGEPPTS